MADDPSNWVVTVVTDDYQCVEMPCLIVDLRTVDGRLICELGDGRVIDMTDWFGGGECQNVAQ
jgi:hypothetical protein